MNQLAKLALQSKAFRERLQDPIPEENKYSAKFLKKLEEKEMDLNKRQVEMLMEWLGNQRTPKQSSQIKKNLR